MRTIIIVMDSVGCGEMPDAGKFGDFNVNTLGHISESVGGLNMPNLQKMGLGNTTNILGVMPESNPNAYWGKMMEDSAAKDTTVGHWEITGVVTTHAFPVFSTGFPKEVIEKIEKLTGRAVIGNKAASGTEIIKELGEEHVKTGALIVYTSADSVLQVAAHEEVVPLKELYEICTIIREQVMVGEYAVGRIIARPFLGADADDFKRTSNRRDFSLLPPEKTLLDYAKEAGYTVAAVGKIHDIFAGQGITESVHTVDNADSMQKTIDYINKVGDGIIFTNLVDFDMLYGHRRNPVGYANALEEFDSQVTGVLEAMREDDILFITADHGNDPTYTRTTDHTREYVPLIVWKKGCKGGSLGLRMSFADLGQTAAEDLKLKPLHKGVSFLDKIK